MSDSFVDHCHPFLPIVNVALDDAFNTIRKSPPLMSAMIADAARFYCRLTARSLRGLLYPHLDPSVPANFTNLAESQLAQTLLQKQHALSDVQAISSLRLGDCRAEGRRRGSRGCKHNICGYASIHSR